MKNLIVFVFCIVSLSAATTVDFQRFVLVPDATADRPARIGSDNTVTNGPIDLSNSNDITGALPSDNIATTLDAKTLTAPTITPGEWTNAAHNHQDAGNGGTLDTAAIASGTLNAARLPALTGDVNTSTGSAATTLRQASSDFAWASHITPSQIAADQNDYNPSGFDGSVILFLSSDASRNITGLVGQSPNETKTIFNVGSNPIVFKNASSSSAATNRFAMAADLTLNANQGIEFIYKTNDFRWTPKGGIATGVSGPGSSTDGAVVTWNGTGGNALNSTGVIIVGTNITGGDATFNSITTTGSGPATFNKGVVYASILSPSQVIADQNDYNPTGLSTNSVLLITTDASRNFTGLTGQEIGKRVVWINTGAQNEVLKDASASSAATNRFALGGDITLAPGQGVDLIYINDGTNTRWRPTRGAIDASAIQTGTIPASRGGTGITSLGTGVATALGVAVNTAGGFSTIDGTATLSNKRITARITSITSSATPTVNTDNADCVTITALAAAITSMTTNLSGTPNNFDQLEYRIKDDGTARAITWGASFVSGPATLPTTTVVNKALHVYFEWDSVQSKWVCMSTGSDA